MSVSRRDLLKGSLFGGAGSALAAPALAAMDQAPLDVGAKKPRGIVFMVSDGMSQGVLSMAEAFSQQTRGCGTKWWEELSNPSAVHGLMDTASWDSLVTDSAAAATAWSAGKRVPNGQICIDANGKQLESIGETLVPDGVKLGLVTSSRVTHATPAGFATNSPNRDDEDFIAPQFQGRAEIVLGGGAIHFDSKRREDGKDVFAEYAKDGYEVVRSREELRKSNSKKLLGTFSKQHLPYAIDRNQNERDQAIVPTLAEMAEAALSRFLESGDSFLLQVEGARIDHAAHKNDIGALLHEQLDFDDAVVKVLAMLAERKDVLVVMTSDHGNANPGLNGTGVRYRQTNRHFENIALLNASHEKILQRLKKRGRSVEVLTELTKAHLGFEPTKEEVEVVLDVIEDNQVVEWSDQQRNPFGLLGQIVGNYTGVGWTSIAHTSDPTQITAMGPGADEFYGLVRNDSVREKLLGLLLG